MVFGKQRLHGSCPVGHSLDGQPKLCLLALLALPAFVAASMVYYARLSVGFLLAMALVSGIALALVRVMGDRVLAISASIFVAAWIAQFVGHRIEGKKPSFFEDLNTCGSGRCSCSATCFVASALDGKRSLTLCHSEYWLLCPGIVFPRDCVFLTF